MDPLIIFFFLVLVFSVIIHEVSHGFAAEMLGDPTARLAGRLTLNPLPHIDIFGSIVLPAILFISGVPPVGWAKPVPYNPYNLRNKKWGEAIVSGAGPGVNIVLAIVFGLIVRFGTGALPGAFVALAGLIVYVNILLALFNLIPLPPLDGSKILKTVLPWRIGRQFERFEAFLAGGGIFVLIILLFFLVELIGPYLQAFVTAVFWLITGQPGIGMLGA